MRFKIPKVDLRRDGGSLSIDDENGHVAGQLLMGKNDGRTIILLGKYHGRFQTQEECEAFAQGVEEVLNHMTKMSN
jgi:hypothetical protein